MKIIESLRNLNSNVLRIITNSLFLLIESIVGRASSFVLTLVIARHLEIFEFGIYSSVLSFIGIGMTLAEFGINYVLIREIAQQKERSTEFFSGAIIITVPLFFLTAAGILIVATVSHYTQSFILLLAFAALGILANTMVLIGGAVLRAFERMVYLSIVNSIVLACSALAGIIWLQYGAGIWSLTILFVATPVANASILAGYIVPRFVHFSFQRGMMIWKDLIRQAFPLAIFSLCNIIIMRYDILLLSQTRGMIETGVFSAARNITDAMSMLISSVIGATFPFMSVRWRESSSVAAEYYEQTLRFFTIFALAVTMVVFFFADRIVVLLYQSRYVDSVACLRILVWTFALNALGGPVGMLLIITKERLLKYVIYTIPITLICVSLNYWLIPIYGYYAASLIAVIVSLIAFIVKMIIVGGILPMSSKWIQMVWRSLLSAAAMGYVLYGLSDIAMPVLIAVSLLVYVGSLIGLGEFRKELRALYAYCKWRKT